MYVDDSVGIPPVKLVSPGWTPRLLSCMTTAEKRQSPSLGTSDLNSLFLGQEYTNKLHLNGVNEQVLL